MNSKIYSFSVAVCLVLLLTVSAAVVEGRRAGRWGVSAEVAHAAARLAETPETIGPWQLEKSQQLGEQVEGLLECSGYVYRTYVNRATGDVVIVAVILGPPGPISVHTPEICYSSQQYEVLSPRRQEDLAGEHSLWSVSFRSNGVDAQSLVVYYGWSDGSPWQAAENPRFQFAGRPYLYKLQVAGRSALATVDADRAACRRFLEELLPVLEKQVLARGAKTVEKQG